MKNLYVYTLNGRDIEVKEFYDVMCKQNGDIIQRNDNYTYNKSKYSMYSRIFKKKNLDKFDIGRYASKDNNEWFIRFISYEEQQDLVKLKGDMIKAFNDFVDERCNSQLQRIEDEFEAYKIEMLNKRKECVKERDALVELAFKRFL